ncbi:imelysin family protein [Winogradskyella eckloniae]|uniref:imelysin family protein n=1 Tax=Winogradskyella eckloniae TaxID=1089306 RepID=UPI0015676809|nr:imelysin family protein [Winogradskyella eckloniae]NRD20433.1 imelysin family protein [Winogradskyella eckloniae]
MLKKIILFVIVVAAISCSSSDDNGGSNNDDGFDRTALLTNVADNIIIPAFQDLQSKLASVDVATTSFINDKSTGNLDALSDAWLEAYKVWQHVQIYNLGEADNLGGGERGFVSFFNIYPVTVADIENAANTGSYDLNTANYHDAQGFPALDFLIHGIATGDSLPLDKFTTNSDFEGFTTYLTDVVTQMISLNTAIVNNWVSSYRSTFIANTDSGLNGSFNKLANDIVYSYEKDFRAQKIGIPAGIFSNGGTLPETVEAFYKKDVSKELSLEALTGIENLFNGISYNSVSSVSGSSFSTYLEFLDREDLVTEINNQFAAGRNAINGLNDDYTQQLSDNSIQMTAAYDIIQAAVPKLKVDMKQALNFVIDYVDGDGD